MTTAELIVTSAGGGAILAYAIGVLRNYFRNETGLQTVSKSHNNLKTEFINHKDNRAIHLDPQRDAKAAGDLKDMIADGFDSVNGRLDKIDQRCEARGDKCSAHFTRVENKIAAMSGKVNGE